MNGDQNRIRIKKYSNKKIRESKSIQQDMERYIKGGMDTDTPK